MANFSDFLEGHIAGWMANGTQLPTPPTNPHVALHTADPTDTGTVGEIDAATTNYARQSTAAGTGWTLAGGALENAVEIAFPVATGAWGTVSHATLWTGPNAVDHATAPDNAYAIMPLSTAKAIDTNDQLRFPAGTLSFTIA